MDMEIAKERTPQRIAIAAGLSSGASLERRLHDWRWCGLEGVGFGCSGDRGQAQDGRDAKKDEPAPRSVDGRALLSKKAQAPARSKPISGANEVAPQGARAARIPNPAYQETYDSHCGLGPFLVARVTDE